MIEGFNKLIKQEFTFPIMNAANAKFRIDSVNEVKDEGDTKWYGVLGCKYVESGIPYMGMPDYAVFTIEEGENGKYKISGMITNYGSKLIEVKKSEINTMDGFLNQLKEIGILFSNDIN